ncbi:MAG: GNAT family N-acetyltransferase [Alphaproteobacteria bacterium]|nr:GNAT family N-acetyltransferase [Alphaproteobacteria bacterium]
MSGLTLTEDCAAHADAIAAMVREAFAARYGSGDGEAALIAAFRRDGDVVAELLALEDGRVVGHVMFSRLSVEPTGRALAALAPVTARIGLQKRGIGGALIREGHRLCAARGVAAIAVLGDPGYYSRFGYSQELARELESPYSGPHFQAHELRPGALAGGPWKVRHARAFG